MIVRLFTVFVAVALIGAAASCSSQNVSAFEPTRATASTTYDVTNIWNNCCAQYSFRVKTPGITFAQAYYGAPGTEQAAFDAIKLHVNGQLEQMGAGGTGSGIGDVMGAGGTGSGIGDIMSVGIENWVYVPTR